MSGDEWKEMWVERWVVRDGGEARPVGSTDFHSDYQEPLQGFGQRNDVLWLNLLKESILSRGEHPVRIQRLL